MPPSGSYPATSLAISLSQLQAGACDQIIGRQVVQCSSVAALTFLTWDILITLDDEVRLIWSKPWIIIKYLYLAARYIPLMVQISILFVGTDISAQLHYTPHDCYLWQVYQGVATLTIVGVVDVILVLRVIALYQGNVMMRRTLRALYVLELVGMSVGLSLAIPRIELDAICLVVEAPHSLFIYGGSAIIFQIILFILTFVKFFQALRSGWGDVPLILLLVRDGTWAFLLLMAVYLGQASLFALNNHALSGLLYGWLLTALSFSNQGLPHCLEPQPYSPFRTTPNRYAPNEY